jgi:deazaflavin-dependent oxidoreductase (nitroreductase family)
VLDDVGDQLVGWGRAARIVARGRRTGKARPVVVGFVEEPDGSLLVAADADASWGANLVAEPRCEVTVADRTWAARADPLSGDDRARSVRELILKYGTPSERLGGGPAFRLVPVSDGNARSRPVESRD